jgi:hypothetical protein
VETALLWRVYDGHESVREVLLGPPGTYHGSGKHRPDVRAAGCNIKMVQARDRPTTSTLRREWLSNP